MRMTLLFALCALSGCDKLWTGFLSPCEKTGYGCPDGYVPPSGDGGVNDASMPDFSEPETDMAGGPPNLYSVGLDDYNQFDPTLMVGSNVSTLFLVGQPNGTPMPKAPIVLSSSMSTLRLIGVAAYRYNNNLLRLVATDQGQIWESRAGANFQQLQGLPGSGALNGFDSGEFYVGGMQERHTFAVGANGRILHRKDTSMSLGSFADEGITGNTSYLRGVSALVEPPGVMIGTRDMGADMASSERLAAWAVGEGGALLERGATGTWSVVPDTAGFQKPPFALYGVDAALHYNNTTMTNTAFVWAVGHGNIAVNKVDGGWATYTLPGAAVELYAVSAPTDNFAVAVGANSTIYTWSRSDFQWKERTVMMSGVGSLPRVKLRAIYTAPGSGDSGPYYIVGDAGTVLRYYPFADQAELLSYR